MIDTEQFLTDIIKPCLKRIDGIGGFRFDSPSARKLLLGTAIQESRLTYIKQIGGGPALGFFQMEPDTHDDIWENYINYRESLFDSFGGHSWGEEKLIPPYLHLLSNMDYAAYMCRVHYYRAPEPLPELEDDEGFAKYWKKYYNTEEGAGTVDEYMYNWNRLGLDDGHFK